MTDPTSKLPSLTPVQLAQVDAMLRHDRRVSLIMHTAIVFGLLTVAALVNLSVLAFTSGWPHWASPPMMFTTWAAFFWLLFSKWRPRPPAGYAAIIAELEKRGRIEDAAIAAKEGRGPWG